MFVLVVNAGSSSLKYQLFDMLANRFLRQFDRPSFVDFLSTRAEYPPEVLPLLNTFFLNKMNANTPVAQPVVDSVRELGLWLNSVAYFSVKDEIRKDETKKQWFYCTGYGGTNGS